jgi:hypothetical protein
VRSGVQYIRANDGNATFSNIHAPVFPFSTHAGKNDKELG